MWRIRPKHTPESVATELVRGLEDGGVVLGADDPPAGDAVARAVAGAVAETRRAGKGPAETLAAVTAAARVLGTPAG